MELRYIEGKAYPHQIIRETDKGKEQVIGIGKNEQEAWEAAALELDNRLFTIVDAMNKVCGANQ